MRFDNALLLYSLLTLVAGSAINVPRHVERFEVAIEPRSENTHEHDKRRGGGGGGGRGGGGGGRSGGKSGSKGSPSRSGSGGSGGSGGSRSGSGSSGSGGSRSNSGGSSSRGSGPPRSFAGGRYYGGGAAVPYRAGGRSPSGILPFLLLGSALAFWPGVWLYGAYIYNYENNYRFRNETSGQDEELAVICGCSQNAVCGCDEPDDTEYLDELVGNGDYFALNKSIVDVANVNGTMSLLINGTLPEGTTAPSAAGGGFHTMLEHLGLWPAIAAVIATVFLV